TGTRIPLLVRRGGRDSGRGGASNRNGTFGRPPVSGAKAGCAEICLMPQPPPTRRGKCLPPEFGWSSSGSSKQFVCSLQGNAPEANRIILLLGKEFTHDRGGRACVVITQCCIHPSCGEKDIAGPLNLDQQVE